MSYSPSPRYAPNYLTSFDDDRCALGFSVQQFDLLFSAQQFDLLFRRTVFEICDDPWLRYSAEVPQSDGMRMLATREAFPDIPPLYVYYRFNAETRLVDFFGLSAAWSRGETF